MPQRLKEEEDEAGSDGGYFDGDHQNEFDELQGDASALFPGISRPTMRTFEAVTLYEMVRDGQINLTPKYQRDEVWSNDAQARVITSYMQKYHVPPLVLSAKPGGRFNCIDGKQRLTSIKRFFAGELPIASPGISTKFWYIRNERNKNRPGSLLPPTQKWRAEKLEIYVTVYNGLTDQQEREMFKRVQDGKSLNLAEKLHAIDSEWANCIREINDGIPEKYWERIHFRTSRMASFLNLCRLLRYLTRLGYPSHLKLDNVPAVPSSEELGEWLTRKLDMPSEELKEFSPGGREISAPTAKFKALVDAIFNKFKAIINSNECYKVAFCAVDKLPIAKDEAWVQRHYPKGTDALRMTSSPVEVICSCIYISRNLRLPLATLARGIHNIRNLIYERFPSERKLNKKVMGHFFSWLKCHNGDGGVAADYQTPAQPPDTDSVPSSFASSSTAQNGQLPQKRAAVIDSSQADPNSKRIRTETVAPAQGDSAPASSFAPIG